MEQRFLLTKGNSLTYILFENCIGLEKMFLSSSSNSDTSQGNLLFIIHAYI
jgi:hypothetical protein